jgi:peptidoglycan/xylan/chitin deacetylase (PgdA/CDA1 family)
VAGTPVIGGITSLKLTVQRVSGQANVTAKIDMVATFDEPATIFPNGVVSICFDDGDATAYSSFLPKLAAQGIRATHYIISELVGTAGHITLQQLRNLSDLGHEIGGHAFAAASHTAGNTGITAAALDADLRSLVGQWRSLGFRPSGYANPFGKYGLTTDGASTANIVRKYWPYSRITGRSSLVVGKSGETFPPADPYRLRALSSISSYSGGVSVAQVEAILDGAKAHKAWTILTFHRSVDSSPASTSDIIRTDFEAIVDYIVANGMTCLPVIDVLQYYG